MLGRNTEQKKNWMDLIVGGYKTMGVNDRDKWGAGGFRYNITLHGPVLGLNFVWYNCLNCFLTRKKERQR